MSGDASVVRLAVGSFWTVIGGLWLAIGMAALALGIGLALGGTGSGPVRMLLLTGGGALSVLGGILLCTGMHRVACWRRLLRDGHPAGATVTAVDRTQLRYGQRHRWRIRYQYTDASGQIHPGVSPYLSMDEATAWVVGDVGEVRFDPHRPKDSIWVGEPGGSGRSAHPS